MRATSSNTNRSAESNGEYHQSNTCDLLKFCYKLSLMLRFTARVLYHERRRTCEVCEFGRDRN